MIKPNRCVACLQTDEYLVPVDGPVPAPEPDWRNEEVIAMPEDPVVVTSDEFGFVRLWDLRKFQSYQVFKPGEHILVPRRRVRNFSFL